MYNRLYSYLTKHNLLYNKQFVYYLHLVDKIYQSFDKNKYILGVLIDLSKEFDTIDKSYLKNLNIME